MKTYHDLLTEFYNEVSADSELKSTIDAYWEDLRCDLYFKPSHKRCTYPNGNEFPDYILYLKHFCDSFDDMLNNYEALVEELERIADARELDCIYFCDRMSDGSTDSFGWMRRFE
jgi:hypothetical protein